MRITLILKAHVAIDSKFEFSGTVTNDNVYCRVIITITDSDWYVNDPRSGKPESVIIGDNVRLGINTVVLKGICIGKNSVIVANSIVTKNILANMFAAGNPCKIIKII